jgi:SAM-dependent methyltransferase
MSASDIIETMSRLEAFAHAAPERVARAIADATNELTRRNPAPRDFPFFALDHGEGSGGKLLDRLSELGIFRFYEHVLDLACGLGGPARWLARRRGCSVVTVSERIEEARASRLLVERAHLAAAVRVAVSWFAAVPAADGAFTHAWAIESLGARTDLTAVVAELHRVVRPGGHVAIQEWVSGSADRFTEPLRAAGFRGVRTVIVTELRETESTVGSLARERAEELAGEPAAAAREQLDAEAKRLAAHRAASDGGEIALVHVFAQKPA